MKVHGQDTYQWDAEGRLKSVDNGNTATYTFNALGWRVEKKVGGAYTEVLYDQSGESLGENNRSTWTQSAKNTATPVRIAGSGASGPHSPRKLHSRRA